MKELTIEQKAQRYDEAIEIAKRINNEQQAQPFNIMTRVFPELKESEDERIRKEIIELVMQPTWKTEKEFHRRNELCVWLEKQREQKPVISDDALREGIAHFGITQYQIDNWLKKYVDVEKQGEHANFINKIQIGDKVTRNEDGVLVNLSQLKRVAKKDEKQGEQKSFAKYKVGDTIYYNSFGRLVNFVIANIVEDGTDNPMYEDKDGNSVFQNDIVEQKPADTENGTNGNDREIPISEQKPNTDFSDLRTWKYIVDAVWTEKEGIGQYLDSPFTEEVAKKLQKRFGNIEQKPAWSDEDEKFVHGLIRGLAAKRDIHGHTTFSSDCIDITQTINWLKSLKERVQPQPKQWSEEDDQYLLVCKNALAKYQVSDKWDAIIISRWLEDKLKSLRHQPHWKPSDEQMRAIEHICDGNYNVDLDILDSIYRDFKKLRK